jgi:uncharacterized repeat protein (TIGR03803 family)
MPQAKALVRLSLFAFFTAFALAAYAQESVIYTFTGIDGDAYPSSNLVFDAAGNLYGTTGEIKGNATVFELTPGTGGTWTEKVIYRFDGLGDYVGTFAGLIIDPAGNLYWTVPSSAANQCGLAYELSPQANNDWAGKVLYSSFGEGADGCEPQSTLARDEQGNLYGTTDKGGQYDFGTVFELSPGANGTWSEKVLWSFAGSPTDGSYPTSGLVLDKAGNLYGATALGLNNPMDYDGYGLAFELMPQAGGAWTEKILHNLGSRYSGGAGPSGNMIFDDSGNLYGTTSEDGDCDGCGNVYEISPHANGKWTENDLYQFDPALPDGYWALGGVVLDRSGNLYGTTVYGPDSQGTVYELTPEPDNTWAGRVVYAFKGGNGNGYSPYAGLILDAAGNLYGTTMNGGIPCEPGSACSFGTVFKIESPNRTTPPTFSKWAGTYDKPLLIKIQASVPFARIYYTTDGEEPTADSAEYTEPIAVKESRTIRAIAIAPRQKESEVSAAEYRIEKPAETPRFFPKPGIFTSIQTIRLSDAISNATIYYTTNGERPTGSSTKYTAPFEVSSSLTIAAIAVVRGRPPSSIVTATYAIHLPTGPTPLYAPQSIHRKHAPAVAPSH